MGTVEHSGQCHDRARNGKSASEFPFLSGLRKWLVRLLWCLFFNMHEHDVNNTIILSSKIPIIKYFGYIGHQVYFIRNGSFRSYLTQHYGMAPWWR